MTLRINEIIYNSMMTEEPIKTVTNLFNKFTLAELEFLTRSGRKYEEA